MSGIRSWTRLLLRATQHDFVDLVRRAQPYSPYLQGLRIASWQDRRNQTGDITQEVEILCSPKLIARWESAADGNIRIEHMAEGDIIHTAMRVLLDRGRALTPF